MPKPKNKPPEAERITTGLPAGVSVTPGPNGAIAINLDLHASSDEWRAFGGSENGRLNAALMHEVLALLPPSSDPQMVAIRIAGAMGLLEALAPADGVEGMISVQAVALHVLGMEAGRRAMTSSHPESAARLRKDAANMMRGTADMLAALDRKRGKGQHQYIRVERVLVTEGGAMIGRVEASALQNASPLPALPPVVAVENGRGGE